MKRSPDPTIERIVTAQTTLIETLPNMEHDPSACCWACGWIDDGFKPTRAHIVSHAMRGPRVPTNYLLLCEPCHRGQPDRAPRAVQLLWLRSRPHWFAAMVERHRPIVDALTAIGNEAGPEVVGWFDVNSLRGLMTVQMDRRGAVRRTNVQASAMWSAVAAFRDWCLPHA